MRLLLLFFVVITLSKNNFAQNYNVDAYTFHQDITRAQQKIGNDLFEFNRRATELNLKILKFTINKNIAFLDSLKVYNNETTYYNSAKKLFELYKDLAENECEQLLKIIEDPDLEFPEFKAKKIKIFDSIKLKTEKAYPPFIKAQDDYCTKYKIKIE